MNPSTPSLSQSRRSRKKRTLALKLVRRIHMYLGLFLVPWVVLFGASGFLFNHYSTFWGGSVQTLAVFDGESVVSESSLHPLSLEKEMETIISEINAQTGESSFSLHGSPWLSGHLQISGKANGNSINVTLDPTDGSARVSSLVSKISEQEKPSFDELELSTPLIDFATLAPSLRKFFEANGLSLDAPLRDLNGRGNAEIRFVLEDKDGRLWRGSYNLATNKLAGVADDAQTQYTLASAMTRLHKTHPYPDTFGTRWLWTLVSDITALSMVVWGLTGLIMWWQIQPTRTIGAIAVFIAALAAFFIFSGTMDDYTHNPVQTSSR